MADIEDLNALAHMLKLSNLTIDELAGHLASGGAGGITLSDFREGGHASMSIESRAKHRGYVDVLIDGLPGMCWCLCIDCVSHRDPDTGTYTCPCTANSCACPSDAKTTSEAPFLEVSVNDAGLTTVRSRLVKQPGCQTRLIGLGDLQLRQVSSEELQVMTQWVKRRALGRWARRNHKRKAANRPLFDYDGRSAIEGFVTATRAWFEVAVTKRHITENPASDIDKPKRRKSGARNLSLQRLEELWDAIFDTGSDDVDLDMLLVWFHLESGARREGAINLTVGGLDPDNGTGRLDEKYGDKRNQPLSPELIATLLAFARSRGAIDGHLPPDAPVFYYKPQTNKDGSPKPPRPLTARRYDTLINRLRRRLPWADRMFLRPHDFRKTAAAFIERAAGQAVARAYLGHSAPDVTSTYTAAGDDEVRRAHKRYTGQIDR